MVKILFDTNIVIDVLNGVPEAEDVLDRFPERAISIITWIEVMVGAPAKLEDATRAFLRGFEVMGLTQDVANQAVQIRQDHRLKLPDAMIWATAKAHGLRLLTRDTKGFPRHHPDIEVPYELGR